MGGVGNQYTTRVEMSAKKRRGQKAQTHGRRGLSPLDHRAASHPPKIWKGKSIRTAIARSSRPKPFSTNLSEVTASLAWKPTFAKICMMMSDCTSVLGKNQFNTREQWRGQVTLQFANLPYSYIDGFDTHFVLCALFSLKLKLKCIQGNGTPKITSVSKKTSQSVTRKQITLQKRRYVLNVSSGSPHF
jgi:hypothetical protein